MPSTSTRHVRMQCAALGDEAVFLRMSASEALGRLSRFELVFLSTRNDIDPGAVLGENLSVTLDYPAGGERQFNGIVTTLRLIAPGDTTRNRMARYDAVVHPRLWLLTQASHRRFFYQRTVPQIVAQVLEPFDIDFRNACTRELSGARALRAVSRDRFRFRQPACWSAKASTISSSMRAASTRSCSRIRAPSIGRSHTTSRFRFRPGTRPIRTKNACTAGCRVRRCRPAATK